MVPSILNIPTVTEKLKKYCAYRERCVQEVRQKLQQECVSETEAGKIIVLLMKEGFLNEERYATTFARGKFRINGWGRRKIEAALLQQNIPGEYIRKGLSEIGEGEYQSVLEQLIRRASPGKLSAKEKMALLSRLTTKGFEPELIRQYMETAGFL